jgi:hypothetical protein
MPLHRRLIACCAATAFALIVIASESLSGHGTEARYVQPVEWTKPHISHTYGLSYTQLGAEANRNPVDLKPIENRTCVTGTVIGFDVDDAYAFDIDEPVTLTLTYATRFTQPFAVYWDMSGGEGLGRSPQIPIDSSGPIGRATVTLDRARFAGQGSVGVDIAVSGRGGVAICDIEITRSGQTKPPAAWGRVHLDVKDAVTGARVPARVGLYDPSGRLPLPSDQAVVVRRFADDVRRIWVSPRGLWPSPNRQAFYVTGSYEARVPAGVYQLVATRGFEYRAFKATVDVRPNATASVTASLVRYENLPSQGWYSGDGHIHIQRDVVEDGDVWAQVAGEDVHVGTLVQMGNIATTSFNQPAWGKAGRFERDGHVIASGQEDPRTVEHGHTLHVNLTAPIHLPSDAFFMYQNVFEESHRQGGISGYAHQAELFNGRRGLALDVPFGLVDFIEILQNGVLPTEQWYGYLNMGYKLLPGAGSDFPYMDLPGVVRHFVHLDGPFDPDAWYAAFRRGHEYVSNGPLLDFTVNGRQMGEELKVPRGARLQIVADARLNPDVDRLSRLELVSQGDVVATVQANGKDRVQLRTELTADHGMWLAVRAMGASAEERNVKIAHSAPIYVTLDDGSGFAKIAALPALVARQRALLTELVTASVDPMGDLEPWDTRALLVEQWPKQLAALKPRIEEADARYRALLGPAGRALQPLVVPELPIPDPPATMTLRQAFVIAALLFGMFELLRLRFSQASNRSSARGRCAPIDVA